jgi:hypothetical protein
MGKFLNESNTNPVFNWLINTQPPLSLHLVASGIPSFIVASDPVSVSVFFVAPDFMDTAYRVHDGLRPLLPN